MAAHSPSPSPSAVSYTHLDVYKRQPHDFPPPLRLIDERCPDPAYADKHLGLWRVADIPAPAAS